MDQLLQQASNAIRQKLDPRLLSSVDKLFNVGKILMYSPKTQHMTFKAMQATDPEVIGTSFGAMAVVLHSQNSKVPMQIVIPTAQLLLCEGLQFMEDAGKIKVNAAFLGAATKAMFMRIMQLVKATPQRLEQMKQSGQGSAPVAPASAPPPAAPAQPAVPTGGGILSGGVQGVM